MMCQVSKILKTQRWIRHAFYYDMEFWEILDNNSYTKWLQLVFEGMRWRRKEMFSKPDEKHNKDFTEAVPLSTDNIDQKDFHKLSSLVVIR